MKHLNKYFLIIVAIAGLLSSCESDRCKTRGIECQNQGTCFDGVCTCPVGWIGKQCDTTANNPFLGKYGGLLVTSPNSRKDFDTLQITKGPTNIDIYFRSIVTSETRDTFNVKARILNNKIAIENYTAANGFTYIGAGSLNKDILTLSFYKDSIGLNGIKYFSDTLSFAGERVQ